MSDLRAKWGKADLDQVPPAHVRNFLDRLQRIIVARREPGIDDLPRNAHRLGCAEIDGFDNGAQHALGRYRVFSDVLAISRTRSRNTATTGGQERC